MEWLVHWVIDNSFDERCDRGVEGDDDDDVDVDADGVGGGNAVTKTRRVGG